MGTVEEYGRVVTHLWIPPAPADVEQAQDAIGKTITDAVKFFHQMQFDPKEFNITATLGPAAVHRHRPLGWYATQKTLCTAMVSVRQKSGNVTNFQCDQRGEHDRHRHSDYEWTNT